MAEDTGHKWGPCEDCGESLRLYPETEVHHASMTAALRWVCWSCLSLGTAKAILREEARL